MRTSSVVRSGLWVVGLAVFLILPPASFGDEKDEIIDRQRKIIEKLTEALGESANQSADQTAKVESLSKKLKQKDQDIVDLQDLVELHDKFRQRKEKEADDAVKHVLELVIKQQADIKKYRTEAVQYEAVARVRQRENERLQEQVRELTAKLAAPKKGAKAGFEPNPPPIKVDGKIEKLERDLMQISLGTDQGVNKDNTLDVYRLKPEPKYLGVIRIVDASTQKSVARLVNGDASKLRAGDLVTSKLEPTKEPKKK